MEFDHTERFKGWSEFIGGYVAAIKPFDRATVQWPGEGGPHGANVEEAVPRDHHRL